MDTPPFLEDMEQKAKQLSRSLAKALKGVGKVQLLTKESELLAVSPSSLIHITNGVFRCQHGGKTIRLYSSSDFLLTPGVGEAGGISITSEFGAEVVIVSEPDFLDALTTNRGFLSDWLAYQNLETRIGHLLCSLYILEEVKHQPEIRQYAEGEVIIREEDSPQEVYEMITGTAAVTSKGIALATIYSGEIFGELSFFTGLTRTATVIASEACLVQAIDQKQFIRIMKYRPALVEGILRTLCQRLVNVNSQVIKPTKE
jgi:CRP-like cAMP-binding protein